MATNDKSVGPARFLFHAFMTVITGGLWLVGLLLVIMLKKI